MIVAGDVEIPDNCPRECPVHTEKCSWELCARCPVFCCKKLHDPVMGYWSMIDPSNYRKDWALSWKKWFESGMLGYPELELYNEERTN